MRDNTLVPDKVEAFLLQVRHALFELISVDDRIVSVEALDDVAVECDDKTEAIQMKSTVSNGNPAANKSPNFWKTLYNWCNYVHSGAVLLDKITFKYVVVSNHHLKKGSIPESFHSASTEEEAATALSNAHTTLLGEKNEKTISESTKKYLDYCFDSKNEKTILAVIQRLQIEIHSDSYDDELREKFSNQTIPQEYADTLFLEMLGWVQEQVHLQIKDNKPAYISAQDYRKELVKQMRGCDQQHIFAAISTRPDEKATTSEVERKDTYIRQLDIIDADTTLKFKAANDFLRTSVERTELAKRGLVTQKSLDDYNETLRTIWANQRRTTDMFSGILTEKQRGSQLFSVCSTEAIKIRLQGCDTQSFFGDGSLHTLANEPKEHPTIGWHPRYGDVLKEQK